MSTTPITDDIREQILEEQRLLHGINGRPPRTVILGTAAYAALSKSVGAKFSQSLDSINGMSIIRRNDDGLVFKML